MPPRPRSPHVAARSEPCPDPAATTVGGSGLGLLGVSFQPVHSERGDPGVVAESRRAVTAPAGPRFGTPGWGSPALVLDAAAMSITGPRPDNQDAGIAAPHLLAVADGVGGN